MKAYFKDNPPGGELQKAKALLNDNPSLAFARDSYGSTPLHLVAAKGYKDVVKLLLATSRSFPPQRRDGSVSYWQEWSWRASSGIYGNKTFKSMHILQYK